MKKYQSYLLGFLISLVFAIFIFLPQVYYRADYLILLLIYGYAWLIPITIGIIFLTRKIPHIRLLVFKKQFTYGLIFVTAIILIMSWIEDLSNDAISTIFWIVILLIWLKTYFNLNENWKKVYETTHNIS